MDLERWGVVPTLVIRSVRELLLVIRRFLKKSVIAVCLVPGLVEGPYVERNGDGSLFLFRLGLIEQSARTRRSFRFGGLL